MPTDDHSEWQITVYAVHDNIAEKIISKALANKDVSKKKKCTPSEQATEGLDQVGELVPKKTQHLLWVGIF